MKSRILQILGVAAIATIGMVSCDTDACKDVICENGGECVEGDCECVAGYEGTNCETEERAKFTGDWNFTDSCAPGSANTSEIKTSNASVTRVLVSNILGTGLGGQAYAEITNGTKISIPSQSVSDVDGDSWTVSSTTGTYTNDSFDLTVTAVFGTSQPVVCTFSYTAQ